jgi:catechol 2,3-dioxygenase-like lactoylglutathione lyase family enzyme
MKIKGMQHCGLVVSDLEKSRWFYGTVLGLAEAQRPTTFTFAGAWFRCPNGDEFHLIVAGDTTAPAGFKDPGAAAYTGLATHIALEVEDLAATKAHLEEAGLEILGGPLLRGDGVEQLYLHDPDGYMVEFFQWTHQDQTGAPERTPIRE